MKSRSELSWAELQKYAYSRIDSVQCSTQRFFVAFQIISALTGVKSEWNKIAPVHICALLKWAEGCRYLIIQSFTAPLDTIGPLYTLACHFNMNFWSFRLLDIMLPTSVSTLICWSIQNHAPLFQNIYPNMGGITWCTNHSFVWYKPWNNSTSIECLASRFCTHLTVYF